MFFKSGWLYRFIKWLLSRLDFGWEALHKPMPAQERGTEETYTGINGYKLSFLLYSFEVWGPASSLAFQGISAPEVFSQEQSRVSLLKPSYQTG